MATAPHLNPDASPTPVKASERAVILDVLRGFALLGICVANAGNFSLYIFQKPEELAALETAAIDLWLKHFQNIFIVGKFYSLFSLLFGIGFAIIFFNKAAAGTSRLYVFYRRLALLMLFGLVHSFLIWDGDILFFYALAGAFLPLFRNWSNKALLTLTVVLLLLPLVFDSLKVLSEGQWNISHPFLAKATAVDQQIGVTDENISTWLLTHDRYQDLLQWNRSGFWWSWQMRLDSNRFMNVFAMFLLGLYVGRLKLYNKLRENKAMLRRIQYGGWVIGLTAGLAYTYFQFDKQSLPAPAGLLDTLAYMLNVPLLCLAYVATLALWYIKNPNLFRWLQPVGSMALTNYIAQTLFGIGIYFGIGAGLGSGIGPAVYMPVALLVFFIQVLYSYYWMKHFNYGPLEWIWRQLTYGKRLPLVRQKGIRALQQPPIAVASETKVL